MKGCLNLLGRIIVLIIYGIVVFFNVISIPGVSQVLFNFFFQGNSMESASIVYGYFFMPPTFVFRLWGPIYTLLLIWVVMSLIYSFRSKTSSFNHTSLGIFVLTCGFNLAFLFLFNYGYKVPALVSIILLTSSIHLVAYSISSSSVKLESTFCDKFGYNAIQAYASFTSFTLILGLMMNLNFQFDIFKRQQYILHIIHMLLLGLMIISNLSLSRVYELKAKYDIASHVIYTVGTCGMIYTLTKLPRNPGNIGAISIACLCILLVVICAAYQCYMAEIFTKKSKKTIIPIQFVVEDEEKYDDYAETQSTLGLMTV